MAKTSNSIKPGKIIHIVNIDPSYRFPAIGIAKGDPADPVATYEPLSWNVPWITARVMGIATPAKVAAKVIEDVAWIKKAWAHHAPPNEPKRVVMEWTRMEKRSTGMMHFLMYVGMMYLLLWVWSRGNVLTVQPSIAKGWLQKTTGIKLFAATPSGPRGQPNANIQKEASKAKQATQAIVDQLQVIHRARSLPTVDEIAESRPYTPVKKDRYLVYEGLCDMICIGIYGLGAWARTGPQK